MTMRPRILGCFQDSGGVRRQTRRSGRDGFGQGLLSIGSLGVPSALPLGSLAYFPRYLVRRPTAVATPCLSIASRDCSGVQFLEYAFSVLKVQGIALLTSYGDKWLGNAAYQSVFEELNRRRAVVFVHPTAPLCCRTLLPDVAAVVA